MAQSVKTAVIPAGGWGTRFLPATKSIPKEMFPLGNKPIILHVVEEAVKSGIENIIFIVSHHKQSIESFFSANQILENYFEELGKDDKVQELRKITSMAEFSFVYTKPPYGNGGCLFSARHLLENNPFVLVWSDELILNKGIPRMQQCIDTFEKYGKAVISAVEIQDPSKHSRYGMVELKEMDPAETDVKQIVRIVEKPKPGESPSNYAAHGAYVLPPEIFYALDETKPGINGELWLTDVINQMMKTKEVLAKIIPEAEYLDCGNPLEYLLSQIDFALGYSDYSEEVLKFIADRVASRRGL